MIENLIKKVSRALDTARVRYMIIGGQAVLLYGTPRLTRDIDITLGVATDQFFVIAKLCKKLNLRILPKKPQAFVRSTHVLPVEDPKLAMRLDFIFSFSPYEKQAIQRAREVRVGGYGVKFASPEDVIIHKMVAGRAIDLEDIKNIMLKQCNQINLGYIRRWLSKFARLQDQKEILRNFNRIWKAIA